MGFLIVSGPFSTEMAPEGSRIVFSAPKKPHIEPFRSRNSFSSPRNRTYTFSQSCENVIFGPKTVPIGLKTSPNRGFWGPKPRFCALQHKHRIICNQKHLQKKWRGRQRRCLASAGLSCLTGCPIPWSGFVQQTKIERKVWHRI